MNAAAEMRTALGRFATRCREQRWLRPLVYVRVLTDIEQDLEAESRRRTAVAYAAEQELLELAKALPARSASRLRRIAGRLHDLAETTLLVTAFLFLALGYALTFSASVRGDNELRTARPARSASVRATPTRENA